MVVTRCWRAYQFQSGRESVVHVLVRPTALLLRHLSSPGLADPNCERRVRALSGRYTGRPRNALWIGSTAEVVNACGQGKAMMVVVYAWELMLGLGAGACRTYYI